MGMARGARTAKTADFFIETSIGSNFMKGRMVGQVVAFSERLKI